MNRRSPSRRRATSAMRAASTATTPRRASAGVMLLHGHHRQRTAPAAAGAPLSATQAPWSGEEGTAISARNFSEPAGLPEDVHVSKKIECVDCHQTGPGGMGHIERKATCQDCHIEVEQAMAASVHKNVACEACHVKILGGYEMTSWGPGMIESKPNPFKKYSLYYGPQGPPILIKDQNRHLDADQDLAEQRGRH